MYSVQLCVVCQDMDTNLQDPSFHSESQQTSDTGFVSTVTIDIIIVFEKRTLYYQELQCITGVSAFRLKGSRHCMVHTHVIHLKNH